MRWRSTFLLAAAIRLEIVRAHAPRVESVHARHRPALRNIRIVCLQGWATQLAGSSVTEEMVKAMAKMAVA